MSTKWSSAVLFPTDSNFINRVTEVTFGESKSSGNPMITVKCEVVSPQEVEMGGETYNIAGVATTNYFPTKNVNDEEKSLSAQKRLKDFLTLAFPDKPEYVDNFNYDNPDGQMLKELEGKLFLTMMSPEEKERRKNPTTAQIEAARKTGKRAEGDVMKHPITGKALIIYEPKIREFFGLAPQSVLDSLGVANAPY